MQITLPTGTKVTFNYGYSYVDGINIIPSVLDTGMTKGLCGIYNGNADDDFMPRDELTAVSSIETFASSWKYVLDLFNILFCQKCHKGVIYVKTKVYTKVVLALI